MSRTPLLFGRLSASLIIKKLCARIHQWPGRRDRQAAYLMMTPLSIDSLPNALRARLTVVDDGIDDGAARDEGKFVARGLRMTDARPAYSCGRAAESGWTAMSL
jgi:hypothetical protein